jgi:hypothetical protein
MSGVQRVYVLLWGEDAYNRVIIGAYGTPELAKKGAEKREAAVGRAIQWQLEEDVWLGRPGRWIARYEVIPANFVAEA